MDINAIVYTSATGFTARYAALLAERTRLPAYELAQAGTALSKRAPVLYLGWLCAGGIKGLKKAAARFDVKAVCAVGMSLPDPAYTAKLALPAALKQVPLFYLRGGYAPDRLTGVYRPMMALMTKAVTRTPPKDAGERAMQDAFLHGGWFEVRSWPGVGTRMTVVLPLANLGGQSDDSQEDPGADARQSA